MNDLRIDNLDGDSPDSLEQVIWSNHPIATWLATAHHQPNETEQFYGELCDRLVAAGVPLFRAACGLLAMHPQIFARNVFWRRGAGTELITRQHGIRDSEQYRQSPVFLLHQGLDSLRRRLDLPDTELDFPILGELKAAGATDYVAMALRFSTGQINYVSWATDREGGFTTDDLTLLHDLLPLISLRLELNSAYDMTNSLMETYLGRAAARRVLAGTIRRGEGENIEAAIFFADLQSFTSMADRMPTDKVIAILDDYFDSIIAPVKAQNGDVLKFIGDGLLAIFPFQKTGADVACCRAMTAAIAALKNLDDVNRRRQSAGESPLRSGIALHAGTVAFGNIGGLDRLDFTAIGPAVNEVSRVEALTRVLERPLLATAEFAAHSCGYRMEPLGFHVLRGVREPRELFGLAGDIADVQVS